MYKTDSVDVTPLMEGKISGGFASELPGSREIKVFPLWQLQNKEMAHGKHFLIGLQ